MLLEAVNFYLQEIFFSAYSVPGTEPGPRFTASNVTQSLCSRDIESDEKGYTNPKVTKGDL